MADAYIGVNNVAKKSTGIYIGVNNVAKKVTSAYIGVNNVAKLVYAPSSAGNELCFTAVQSNSSVMLGIGYGTVTKIRMETKKNNQSWTAYTLGTAITLTNIGDKVYFRSATDNDYSELGSSAYITFSMSGSIAASGSVMSLYDHTGLTTLLPSITYCFYKLFENCDVLTTAPEITATNTREFCYADMFKGCRSLTTAPSLPATTISRGSYIYMFSGCTSIVNPPTIEGINMTGENGYAYMFDGCTSLESTPAIKLTTIAINGCQYMFRNCSSLKTLPKLYPTTLQLSCYQYMFNGCVGLAIHRTSSTAHPTAYNIPFSGSATPVTNATYNMFLGTGSDENSPTIGITYYTGKTLV